MDNACAKGIEILRATRDGEDLDGRDLWLVQKAINRGLSGQGEAAFADLHARVVAGAYRRPWLRGVEHLTIGHDGTVRWRGVVVEHFSYWTPEARERLGRYAVALGEVFREHEAAHGAITCRDDAPIGALCTTAYKRSRREVPEAMARNWKEEP